MLHNIFFRQFPLFRQVLGRFVYYLHGYYIKKELNKCSVYQ